MGKRPAAKMTSVPSKKPKRGVSKVQQAPLMSQNSSGSFSQLQVMEVAAAALGIQVESALSGDKEHLLQGQNSMNLFESTSTQKTKYSKFQTDVLSAAFKLSTKPTDIQRKKLGEAIGLNDRQIKTWFQNRRQRERGHFHELENDQLKLENEKMKDDLEKLRIRNKMLEIENDGLQSDLKRRRSKLEDLRKSTEKLLETYYTEFSKGSS